MSLLRARGGHGSSSRAGVTWGQLARLRMRTIMPPRLQVVLSVCPVALNGPP